MTEIWVGPNGEILEGVHPRTACEGRYCCIHNPSDHVMYEFPLHFRNDNGLMERICPHGIGHPDPDALAYEEMVRPGSALARSIHGCDGCCR